MKIGFKEGFRAQLGAFAAQALISVTVGAVIIVAALAFGLLTGCGALKGKDGRVGFNGQDGAQGPAGTNGSDGPQGLPGSPGVPGVPGYNSLLAAAGGAPGCPNGGRTILVGTDLNRDGTLAPEEAGHSFEVCNGSDGAPGANGTSSPVAIAELVDPCGAQGAFDEVLLRLANGQIVASFSENANGKNTRFSLIGPGTYQTTDGTGCVFTVNADGSIQ